MIKKLFILGVIAIPFSDVYGLLPLGEMQYELSAYFFSFAMIAMAAASMKTRHGILNSEYRADPADLLILKLMGLMLGIIAISCIMNFPAMMGGVYRGRYPAVKFMTSTVVILYGFALAYVSYNLGKKYSWHELIVWPTAISVFICAAIAGLEMLAWVSPAAANIYFLLSTVIHSGFEKISGVTGDFVIGRVQSVSFEPPALANYAGFAWPWVYTGLHSAPRNRRLAYFILLILCTALTVSAWSRTSAVLLVGNILVLILLRSVYLSARPRSPVVHRAVSFMIVVSVIAVFFSISFNADSIAAAVTGGDSVSNITRAASIAAAINMFLAHPIWGYGFGQYGFHFIEYLPSWGYYSWEIQSWYTQNPNSEHWPPVYSVYARFGAELGIFGILIWLGIWLWLAKAIWRVTLAYQRLTGNILLMSYPLIMGCYCALLSGIALDSLRTPMMWINLGLGCCYLRHVRSRLPELQKSSNIKL